MIKTDWNFYRFWHQRTEQGENIGLSHWAEFVKYQQTTTKMLEVTKK